MVVVLARKVLRSNLNAVIEAILSCYLLVTCHTQKCSNLKLSGYVIQTASVSLLVSWCCSENWVSQVSQNMGSLGREKKCHNWMVWSSSMDRLQDEIPNWWSRKAHFACVLCMDTSRWGRRHGCASLRQGGGSCSNTDMEMKASHSSPEHTLTNT